MITFSVYIVYTELSVSSQRCATLSVVTYLILLKPKTSQAYVGLYQISDISIDLLPLDLIKHNIFLYLSEDFGIIMLFSKK